MGGILDYLKEYGQYDFAQEPFNEVDNLVLSEIAYTPMDRWLLQPEKRTGLFAEKMTFRRLAQLIETEGLLPADAGAMIYRDGAETLCEAAKTKRFENVSVYNYVNHISESHDVQFCAMVFALNFRDIYVAFRGTDDTVVGWKEDFMLSYRTPIPAQEEARTFIDAVGRPGLGKVYVGGHSKGGNLAVFAGIYAKDAVKKHIVQVYNNDGPGFLAKMMDRPEYRDMLPRIHTYMPQDSVVGKLFEHREPCTVVESNEKGLMQHSALTWQVQGKTFVTQEHTTEDSDFIDQSVKTWLEELDDAQREEFTDALFDILYRLDLDGVHELTEVNFDRVKKTVELIADLDAEQRKMIMRILGKLFVAGGKTFAKIHQFY